MKNAIKSILDRKSLSIEEAKRATDILLSGDATQAQIGTYLTALRMKGETIEEIVGSAMSLKGKAEHINPKVDSYIDIVGTGGDGMNTFNISTTSSFVIAGAGLAVAKHGNRKISSQSGAGDVLEALGVNIMLEPEEVEKSVEEIGIGFMFAQTFHKTMKNVGQARSEMGIRTIFNVIGPISNPSSAKCQLIGVYSPDLTEPIAEAMAHLGIERGMVVCAENGMDEISTASSTFISEIKEGKVTSYSVTPEQFGFERVDINHLRGGNSEVNAVITKEILSGIKSCKRDIVLFNSGAALYIGGLADSIEKGIELAEESIDSGKAMKELDRLIQFSNNR